MRYEGIDAALRRPGRGGATAWESTASKNGMTVFAKASRSRGLRLRLYVAGQSPNSTAALANLREMLPEGGTAGGPVELEVVDVLLDPIRALSDGIIVSPTLVRLFPLPVVRIVGRLSDLDAVRLILELGE